jgi:phage/plasmid-like protein (TIGR03299 family)
MGEYNGVIGGVSSIVTDGFMPWWHGIDGTVEAEFGDESLTVDDAYKRALDWTVTKRPVFVDTGWDLVQDENRCAVVRQDTGQILGHHSDSYGTLQNSVLRDLGNALKSVGDVYAKSAGGLFGDKVTWLLCKLGEDRYFADSDERLQSYLALSTSHDGSLSLTARTTSVRIECMNTFDMHMQGTSAIVTLRHTSKVEDRIAQATKVIETAYDHQNALDDQIRELLDTEYSRTQYHNVLVPKIAGDKPETDGRALTLWEGRKDGLLASYERPDQANIAGTAWGAVMAVNSWELWGQQVRGSTRLESQAKRALTGKFPLTEQARELVLS